MIKSFAFILFSLFFSSCGEIVPPEDQNGSIVFGESLKPSDVKELTSNDKIVISELCSALSSKRTVLSSLAAGSSQVFNFNTSSRKCDETKTTNYSVGLKVQSQGGDQYIFGSSRNNNVFYFNSIETNKDGLISDYCETDRSEVKRVIIDGNSLKIIELAKRDSAGYITVSISTGFSVGSDGEYLITVEDNFNIDNSNSIWRGFALARENKRIQNCRSFARDYSSLIR